MIQEIRQRRSFLAAFAAMLSTGLWAGQFPSQPVRLITPAPPSGLIDIVARMLSNKLAEGLQQSVVVDNKPGAAGNIGAAYVAKANPDGSTLLVGFDGTLVINPSIYPNPGFDTLRDFSPIIKLADVPLLLVANPSVPAKNLKELIAYAKANPKQALSYATSGVGSTPHIAGALLAQRTNLDLVHVPYKGGGQAIVDVIAGQVPLTITAEATAIPYINSGKLVALGIANEKRSKGLPGVPTFQESGLPGFLISSWVGMLAPSKTPADVIARLHREFVLALSKQDIRERFLKLGLDPVGNSSREFAAQIHNDLERYAKVIKAAKITVDG